MNRTLIICFLVILLLPALVHAAASAKAESTYVVTSDRPNEVYKNKATSFAGVYCTEVGMATSRAFLEFDPAELMALNSGHAYLSVQISQYAKNICQSERDVIYLELYEVAHVGGDLSWANQPTLHSTRPIDSRLFLSNSVYRFQIPPAVLDRMKSRERPMFLLKASGDTDLSSGSIKEIRRNARITVQETEHIFDTDGEGLDDVIERQLGTDIHNRDTDGESLSDYVEALQGLNPLRRDSLGDGVEDHHRLRGNACSRIHCPPGVGCENGQCMIGGGGSPPPIRQYFSPGDVVQAEEGNVVYPMQSGTEGVTHAITYVYTGNANSGSASYTYYIETPGTYVLKAKVKTPGNDPTSRNSFLVALDGALGQGESSVYDTVLTGTYTWDDVSLRGTQGNEYNATHDPMIWDLTGGERIFTFYGLEPDTRLDAIKLIPHEDEWCTDEDTDGYGSPVTPNTGCQNPEYDCDDSNNQVNPGAAEICYNSKDDDCDSASDCADSDCVNDPYCASGLGDLRVSDIIFEDSQGNPLGNNFSDGIVFHPLPVIENVGSAPVSLVGVRHSVSFDGNGPSAIGDCQRTAAILLPGTEIICETANLGGFGSTFGPHTVTSFIDYGNVVQESNESNNDYIESYTITGALQPLCGDGTCDPGEYCINCPADCGNCTINCTDRDGDGYAVPGTNNQGCQFSESDCNDSNIQINPGATEICNTFNTDEDCDGFATCDDPDCSGDPFCSPPPPPPGCPNNICDSGETCTSCPADCGNCTTRCGDGTCDPEEFCDTCHQDCGNCMTNCGNGTCDPGENCEWCPPDCIC